MKMKYFLRGLGIGIIFGAFIMLVAYMTSGDKKMTDEEIMDRASELGMVMGNDILDNLEEDKDTAEEVDNIASQGDGKEDDNTSEDLSEEALEEGTTEDKTTEDNTSLEVTIEDDSTTEMTTEDNKTEEEPDDTYTYAEITVSSGMSSSQVAKLLQDAGIIDDYLDFDQYLNENGYSTKIRVNTFKFHDGMTYEELAEELTKETAGQ